MSTIRVTTIQNLAGVEVYTAKAWVNFNGTGTVAIRASGNVTSITDNGVGDYTVNFTVAMPDANYAVIGTSSSSLAMPADAKQAGFAAPHNAVPTTSSVRCATYVTGNGAAFDPTTVNVAIFR